MRASKSSDFYLASTHPRGTFVGGNDITAGAHFGHPGQEPEMDTHKVTRFVERTGLARVGDQGRARVRPLNHPWVRAARVLYRPKGQAPRFTRNTGGGGRRSVRQTHFRLIERPQVKPRNSKAGVWLRTDRQLAGDVHFT
jgi:hypothetical protein